MPRTVPYCNNYPCESKLPEKYYRVIRIIKTGNNRRNFVFCSIKCMRAYFKDKEENQNE